MSVAETFQTSVTQMLGIRYPVMLAGMGSVSGHDLVAAVSNAGGIGTLGGVSFTVEGLRKEIGQIKKHLKPGMPFGVDLLIPKVGEGARKTNADYTEGNLPQLVDVMIEEGVKLFVCAVGVPPKWLVDKMHGAGIVCMNMVGSPVHVPKCLAVGMDIICAQGTEAGGHTGEIATLPLIPQCVDLCKGQINHFGVEVPVVAAGGLYDGRGLGASLCLGAAGVWMGTRFIACEEANAGPVHKRRILEAKSGDTTRIEVFTGRPCRIMRTPYVKDWEGRPAELQESLKNGVIPFHQAVHDGKANISEFFPALMGQCAGAITEVKSADAIVQEVMRDALSVVRSVPLLISKL